MPPRKAKAFHMQIFDEFFDEYFDEFFDEFFDKYISVLFISGCMCELVCVRGEFRCD